MTQNIRTRDDFFDDGLTATQLISRLLEQALAEVVAADQPKRSVSAATSR
ncbi:MAG: hypothetical protein H6Q90_831 [Deltaproteobacteria bacterium]|nr:hypothetical protein [Deltaproteobacteria bacterium]